MTPRHYRIGSRGITTLLVLAFMGVFMLIMSALAGYAFEQAKYGQGVQGREQALSIAEAGLEYYKWYLGHNTGIMSGSANPTSPFTYTVNDPESNSELGKAVVTATVSKQCGVPQWVDISSVGTADINPLYSRTISVRYMRASAARYSYLLNSNVWAGSNRQITGPYFSNGGIRMDGTNNSDVLSPQSTWICTSSYGCSPTQNSAPGVVGSGSGSKFWKWGSSVASVDFSAMQANLPTLKSLAQNQGGLYFAPASGSASQRGYHLIFNSNGTVTVKQVTATTGIISASDDTNDLTRYCNGTFYQWSMSGCWYAAVEYSVIASETLVGTYTIPSSCSLIFVEDRAWIEGVVKGKVTVVAAVPTQSVSQSVPVNVYLPNNITYATSDGTSGLTVISQDSINIALNSPDTMVIHGIFVAQGGVFARNFYTSDSTSYPYSTVPAAYSSYTTRTQLTTNGSVVSNLRTGTAWTDSSGNVISGYRTRVDAYDQQQADAPPPFTPATSQDYGFYVWQEH